MDKPIFLVGLPGSGKSTFGRFLANKLAKPFIDLDTLIEEKENRIIADIFSTDGEEYFRKIESETLKSFDSQNAILATGGGTPCFYENMTYMNDHGLTVFLNPPLSFIVERISKASHRPLINDDPKIKIEQLYKARLSIYKQALIESDKVGKELIWMDLKDRFS